MISMLVNTVEDGGGGEGGGGRGRELRDGDGEGIRCNWAGRASA